MAVLKREIKPRARHQFFDTSLTFLDNFPWASVIFTLEQNKKFNLWTEKQQKQGHSKY